MKKEEKKNCTAIVLSAGQGKRMGASVQKQYIELQGKPIIYYTLSVFQKSEIIDDIILVAGKDQLKYVQEEIVRKYHFTKVKTVVEGGHERYASVWQGLKAREYDKYYENIQDGYVFIHDGARPFVDEEMLERAYDTVRKYKACVAGVPSKDTIKLINEEQFAVTTPERKYVWSVQTPQVFEKTLIFEAYARLMEEECVHVTDDAMVVEQMMHLPVKLFEGSYENIKITTPEDLDIVQNIFSEVKSLFPL